tara:strand:- start:983 stop:1102 length:120 start_codon:yes stop_codon:yes gene_type:complete
MIKKKIRHTIVSKKKLPDKPRTAVQKLKRIFDILKHKPE